MPSPLDWGGFHDRHCPLEDRPLTPERRRRSRGTSFLQTWRTSIFQDGAGEHCGSEYIPCVERGLGHDRRDRAEHAEFAGEHEDDDKARDDEELKGEGQVRHEAVQLRALDVLDDEEGQTYAREQGGEVDEELFQELVRLRFGEELSRRSDDCRLNGSTCSFERGACATFF